MMGCRYFWLKQSPGQVQGSRITAAEVTVVPQLNQGVTETVLDIGLGVLFVSFLDKQKGKKKINIKS